MQGLPRGPHITRYFMYQHLKQVGNTLACKECDVPSISHSQRLCDLIEVHP